MWYPKSFKKWDTGLDASKYRNSLPKHLQRGPVKRWFDDRVYSGKMTFIEGWLVRAYNWYWVKRYGKSA